jgi:hypothetical protein
MRAVVLVRTMVPPGDEIVGAMSGLFSPMRSSAPNEMRLDVATGLAVLVAVAPTPTLFTARTRMEYEVPFVRPEMTTGLVAAVVHDAPAFIEYSTLVTVDPFAFPKV